jgi:DNA-binding transcriptional LysR family regulator
LIRTLTLSGQGVGILPKRVALVDGATLVPFDASLPVYKDEVYVTYRRELLASAAGRALAQIAGAIQLKR